MSELLPGTKWPLSVGPMLCENGHEQRFRCSMNGIPWIGRKLIVTGDLGIASITRIECDGKTIDLPPVANDSWESLTFTDDRVLFLDHMFIFVKFHRRGKWSAGFLGEIGKTP